MHIKASLVLNGKRLHLRPLVDCEPSGSSQHVLPQEAQDPGLHSISAVYLEYVHEQETQSFPFNCCSSELRIKYLTCLKGAASYHLFHLMYDAHSSTKILAWFCPSGELSHWVWTHYLSLSLLRHSLWVPQSGLGLPKLCEERTVFFTRSVSWKSSGKSDSLVSWVWRKGLRTCHFYSGFHPNDCAWEKEIGHSS